LGVTCTYDGVRLFKGSAAATSIDPSPIASANDGLIQAIADNFDAEVASPNGLTSTHSLALLMTQSTQYQQDISDNETIPRIKKCQLNEMKSSGTINSGSSTSVYMDPKKPPIPAVMTKRAVLPLKILAKQVLSVRRANTLDFNFLKEVTSQDSCPEFGGFNVKQARNEGTEQRASTKTMYRPLIDAKSSDPSTIKTAWKRHKSSPSWQDKQQLCSLQTSNYNNNYYVALNVQWVYPNLFGDDFINRLGGMHFLLSFVGAIGSLM
jgi:hypothetical protein